MARAAARPAPDPQPPGDKDVIDPLLWTRPDIETALSLSRTAALMLVKEPDFPAPIRLYGENGRRRWYIADVKAWLAAKR